MKMSPPMITFQYIIEHAMVDDKILVKTRT